MPISRAEYDRHRKRLENYIVLNSDGVSEQALENYQQLLHNTKRT